MELAPMTALLSRRRLVRLSGVVSAQVTVQAVGFACGIVLVRCMEQVQYGYYTLALSLAGAAAVLTDLGLATAVLTIGGRLGAQRRALGQLVADANRVHRRLAGLTLLLLAPCFAVLLLRQQAAPWQVAALTGLVLAAAALHVRNGIALSVARLLGHVGFTQKVDLAVNTSKLAALALVAWIALDATVACAINLGVAAAYFLVLRRHLHRHVDVTSQPGGGHSQAIAAHLRMQAPNAVYFVLSSQLAVWLIGIFGNAERVAQVGALGRLAAAFVVIAAVSAAVVQPYFARRDDVSELWSGFVGINLFFAALLLALVVSAHAFPAPILWVLGGGYASLQGELVWMVIAATLSAWGGTLYSIGCARGWVLPFSWSASTGVIATAIAASLVDVSSVQGSFIINTATGLVGTVLAFGYLVRQLRRHARRPLAIS